MRRGKPRSPSPAHLAATVQDLFVFVRLQKILKASDVRLDLLEDFEATVQAKLSRLRYFVVLNVFPQTKSRGSQGCW